MESLKRHAKSERQLIEEQSWVNIDYLVESNKLKLQNTI